MDSFEDHDASPQDGADDDLTGFAEFTTERWFDWINAFLCGEYSEPKVLVGYEEYDAVLIGLYLRLRRKSSRDQFAEAVVRLYEGTTHIDTNAELIYYLLQLIAYLKPFRAKRIVRRNLLDQVLLDELGAEVPYNDHGLQTLLLSVAGEYEVDDTLIQFIYESTERVKPFSYVLVCFRLLASAGEREAYQFLNRAIPKIELGTEAEDLCLELKAEFARVGYKYFCEWYCDNADEIASRWPQQFDRFGRMLKKHAVPPREEVFGSQDKTFLFLLGLQLFADEQQYDSTDIVEIARKHVYLGVDAVTKSLRNVWRKAALTWERVPWYFTSDSGFFEGKLRRSNLGTIATDIGIRYTNFDIHLEPELEQIFERINTIYLLGLPVEEARAGGYARGASA